MRMQSDHYLLHLSPPHHHIVYHDGAGPNLVEAPPTDLEPLAPGLATPKTDINMAPYNQVLHGSLVMHRL